MINLISGNSSDKSPVELSLSTLFPRKYSSLHDAVDNFFVPTDPAKAGEERHTHQKIRMRVLAEQCPVPVQRNFYLFGLDLDFGQIIKGELLYI